MKRLVFATFLLTAVFLQAQVRLKHGNIELKLDKDGFFSSIKVYGKELLHERRLYPVITAYMEGLEVFPAKVELRHDTLCCQMEDKAWVRITIDSSMWEVVECPDYYTALAIGPMGFKESGLTSFAPSIVPLSPKVIAGAPAEALELVRKRYQVGAADSLLFHSASIAGDGFRLQQYNIGNWNGRNGRPEVRPVQGCRAAWVDIMPGSEGAIVGARWKMIAGIMSVDPPECSGSRYRVSCCHLPDTSRFVSPIPSEHLLRQLQFMMVDSVGPSDTVLRVITGLGSCFPNPMTRHIIKVGQELISYQSADDDEGLVTLHGCERGALGTQASSHKAYDVGQRLWTAADGSLMADRTLLDTLADQIVDKVNKQKISVLHLDDLNDLDYIGHSDYEAARFVERCHQGFDHPVVVEGRTTSAYLHLNGLVGQR